MASAKMLSASSPYFRQSPAAALIRVAIRATASARAYPSGFTVCVPIRCPSGGGGNIEVNRRYALRDMASGVLL